MDVYALGLEHPLDVRIVLHAVPVFGLVGPITRRTSFTGRHVSQTARLEPVTERGEVFCTKAFAALFWAYQASGSASLSAPNNWRIIMEIFSTCEIRGEAL